MKITFSFAAILLFIPGAFALYVRAPTPRALTNVLGDITAIGSQINTTSALIMQSPTFNSVRDMDVAVSKWRALLAELNDDLNGLPRPIPTANTTAFIDAYLALSPTIISSMDLLANKSSQFAPVPIANISSLFTFDLNLTAAACIIVDDNLADIAAADPKLNALEATLLNDMQDVYAAVQKAISAFS